MSLFKMGGWPPGVLGIVLLVNACGFHPLYGAGREPLNRAVVAELASVHIAPMPERVGQIVHNDLLDRLTPLGEPGAPRYKLSVGLEEAKQGLAIQIDDTITRFNLTLTANYVLEIADTGSIVTTGRVHATAAYNVLRSDFANVVAERDAQRRAAREVSDELKTRLAVYFGGGRTTLTP
jgi:LPS-assembly lipoprotein